MVRDKVCAVCWPRPIPAFSLGSKAILQHSMLRLFCIKGSLPGPQCMDQAWSTEPCRHLTKQNAVAEYQPIPVSRMQLLSISLLLMFYQFLHSFAWLLPVHSDFFFFFFLAASLLGFLLFLDLSLPCQFLLRALP